MQRCRGEPRVARPAIDLHRFGESAVRVGELTGGRGEGPARNQVLGQKGRESVPLSYDLLASCDVRARLVEATRLDVDDGQERAAL